MNASSDFSATAPILSTLSLLPRYFNLAVDRVLEVCTDPSKPHIFHGLFNIIRTLTLRQVDSVYLDHDANINVI